MGAPSPCPASPEMNCERTIDHFDLAFFSVRYLPYQEGVAREEVSVTVCRRRSARSKQQQRQRRQRQQHGRREAARIRKLPGVHPLHTSTHVSIVSFESILPLADVARHLSY